MAPCAKKHLPHALWPAEDQRRWQTAFATQDRFADDQRGGHLAPATKVSLRTAYARWLGFLTNNDPARLSLAPLARIDQPCIAAFVAHLRRTCRDTTVSSNLFHLHQALRYLDPGRDWTWLRTAAKRIHAQAKPVVSRQKTIRTEQLYALGLRLMVEAEAASARAGRVTRTDALLFRDGLVIALLAAVPLRRRTLAALTIGTHLMRVGPRWVLEIPAADAKSRAALEFPLSANLSANIDRYLARFRPGLPGADSHRGLWASNKQRPMTAGGIYHLVYRRTKEAFGIGVNLHRFRSAAGDFWAEHDPVNVRAVKDLLGHSGFGTTERHYLGARTRMAGRTLARALGLIT